MRLEDKVVLVTSAQNPCAHAIVTGFAREGAHCVVADSAAGRAEQLAALASKLHAGFDQTRHHCREGTG
ncbi:MAG TPA: hypothetical protein VJ864_02355, partial [Candidatus Binatia bacterium]|nr:hypothetical protein [Candidatus Binatia bacterium]